jgi:hypothetical protein
VNRNPARAWISALFGGVLVGAVLTAGPSSASSPWEPYTFSYGPEVSEDFCDIPGLDVEQRGDVTAGLSRTKTKGRGGLGYWFDWETYSETWTNLANGHYVTVAGSFRGGEHSVTDNGDGTVTAVVQNTGTTRVYDQAGTLLAMSAGLFRITAVFDDGGTPGDASDDTPLSFSDPTTRGLAYDFCAVSVPAIT